MDFPARATHVPRVRMMHQDICSVLRSVFSLDTTVHATTRSCKILPKGQIIRKTFVRLFDSRNDVALIITSASRVQVFRLQNVSCFYFSRNKDLLRVSVRSLSTCNASLLRDTLHENLASITEAKCPLVSTFVITWRATSLSPSGGTSRVN